MQASAATSLAVHQSMQAGPGGCSAPVQYVKCAESMQARQPVTRRMADSVPSVEKSPDTKMLPGGKASASAHSASISDLHGGQRDQKGLADE